MSTVVVALMPPALAVLSGILLALAFPYPSQGFLVWVGLAPLLYVLQGPGKGVKWGTEPGTEPGTERGIERGTGAGRERGIGRGRGRAFLLAWLAGFVFFAVLLYWIRVFGWIAWISLSAAQGFYVGLFGLLANEMLRRWSGWGRLIFIPAAWVSIEYLRSIGPWGFEWGVLGAAVRNLPVLQFASVGGEFGLSSIIVAVNVLIAGAFAAGSWRPVLRQAFVLLAVLVAVYGYGLAALSRPVPVEVFRVALVQGSIPQSAKFDPDFEGRIKRMYLEQTKRALLADTTSAKPDLIVWPETAYPGFLLEDPEYLGELTRLAAGAGSYVLLGSFGNGEPQSYNTAVLIPPTGPVQVYKKMHLVPFGEVIPFRPLVGRINALAAAVEDLAPGRRPVTFKTERGDIAAVICFESSDGFLVRRLIRRGAGLLITITNDAWFGRTSAAEQHFQLSRVRAVENRRFALQAANTGVSGVFDPFGREISRSRLYRRGILTSTVGFTSSKSIYTRIAGIEPYVFGVLALLGLAVRSRHTSSEPPPRPPSG